MAVSKSPAMHVVGLLLVLAALVYLIFQLYSGWDAVGAYPWQWQPAYLGFSLILAPLAYLILARAWRSVLRAIDVRLDLKTAYWIFLLSNLGRYLPGKFWQIGAAAWLGRSVGLAANDVAPSMIVYQLYLIPVGVLLSFSWGALPADLDSQLIRWSLWLGSLVAAVAALWPNIVMKLFGPITRKLGINPDRWRLAWHRRLAIAAQCAAGWLVLSVAFGLFVVSVTPLQLAAIPDLARVFVLSYLVGYVTLLAPGGIGVREGVMTVMLRPVVGAGPAAALAVLARLWVTLTELLAVLPAAYLYRQVRNMPKATDYQNDVS